MERERVQTEMKGETGSKFELGEPPLLVDVVGAPDLSQDAIIQQVGVSVQIFF